jgi:hypothetical protein
MITFKQFLLSEEDTEIETLEEFLSDRAEQLIEDVGLHNLYDLRLFRGLKLSNSDTRVTLLIDGEEKDCYIRFTRAERKPKDISEQITRRLDDEFEERLGWRPRTQGVFCTSDSMQAHQYGDTCRIYPLGDYKCVTSENVDDLLRVLYTVIQKDAARDDLNPRTNMEVKDLDLIFEKLEPIIDSYKNYSVKDAIRFGNETIIKCGAYLIVPRFK